MMERFSGGIHRAQGCPGSRDSRRVPKAQGEAEGFWEQMSPMGGKREGTRDCAAERVHGGSQGRTEGQSPQPGRRGAGRPPAHPAPWWRGAGLEVFPGHQATRVSPGGCNSSSAPVPLSGPAPGACYCRCRAAPPPTGLSLSPSLRPLPPPCQPPLQEAVWGASAMPTSCPAGSPTPAPLHAVSPPQAVSVSPSRTCAHHPKSITQSCQHGQVSTAQGHQQNLRWLQPPGFTTGTLMSSHSDPQGGRNYPSPPHHVHSCLLSPPSLHLPRVCSPVFSSGHSAPSPSIPASPGSLRCIWVLFGTPIPGPRPSEVQPMWLQIWAPSGHLPPCSITPGPWGPQGAALGLQNTSTSNVRPAGLGTGHCSCMWCRQGVCDFIPFGAEPGIKLNTPSC